MIIDMIIGNSEICFVIIAVSSIVLFIAIIFLVLLIIEITTFKKTKK
jgi:hypothetical protein